MLFRVAAVFITLFWLGSLCWLGMVIWAPPESRMAQVDPREVYDVFFGWNDSTTMTLLEGGKRQGQLNVSGGSGVDPVTGIFSNQLSVSASIDGNEVGGITPALRLFWKGTMEFSEDMKPGQGSFSVRVPSKQLTAHLELDGPAKRIKAKAIAGGKELFSFDSATVAGGSVLPLQLLTMSAGQFSSFLDPEKINWETEARMGEFPFGGRDLRAYLLIIKFPEQDQQLKVYFSEAGEPLKIESDIGYEAVSEILVPLEAYRNMKKSEP